MKIVLIDGAETYQCIGAPALHLGFPADVADDVAAHLLQQKCPTGPMFVRVEDSDRRQVCLRLTDSSLSFRSATVYAEGLRPVEVPASIVPFLLRKQRRDGAPLFEKVNP